MNGKKLNEMRTKGWSEYEASDLHAAASFASATKNTFKDVEDEIKDVLEDKMSSMDPSTQLTLDLGDYTYSSEMKDTNSYEFDVTETEMIDLLKTAGLDTVFVDTKLNKTALVREFKKGSLASTISAHIVVKTQPSLKFGRRQKKGGEE